MGHPTTNDPAARCGVPWCRNGHPNPAVKRHSRNIDTVWDASLTVEVNLMRVDEGDTRGEPFVRLFLHDGDDEVGRVDLPMGAVSVFGRVTTEMHPDLIAAVGRALLSAYILGGGR